MHAVSRNGRCLSIIYIYIYMTIYHSDYSIGSRSSRSRDRFNFIVVALASLPLPSDNPAVVNHYRFACANDLHSVVAATKYVCILITLLNVPFLKMAYHMMSNSVINRNELFDICSCELWNSTLLVGYVLYETMSKFNLFNNGMVEVILGSWHLLDSLL